MNALALRRTPFAEFDAVVRNAFGQSPWQPANINFTPSAETLRDGDDAIVRLELPGLDFTKDINVEASGGRLVIRGERRDERAEENSRGNIGEIRYGSFERSFGLPAHIGADAISASYDAGVLTVRVAGVYAGTTPTSIEITQGAPKESEEASTEA